YFLLPRRGRNFWLFCASLVFYAWAEPNFTWLLLISIALNWGAGWAVEKAPARARGPALGFSVAFNLFLLGQTKYESFLLGIFGQAPPTHAMPVGISFFTFHAISYLVDISRGKARAFGNPLDLGLYLAF